MSAAHPHAVPQLQPPILDFYDLRIFIYSAVSKALDSPKVYLPGVSRAAALNLGSMR